MFALLILNYQVKLHIFIMNTTIYHRTIIQVIKHYCYRTICDDQNVK